MPYLIYFAVCLLVGLLGMHRKFGFWGYFFGSVLLTPPVGLLLVLGSDARKRPARERVSDGASGQS
jgi:hypothetical protein